MNKKLKNIILIIILLIIIAINIIVFLNNNKQFKETNTTKNQTIINEYNIATEEETNNSRKEVLSNHTEATRMKTYVGQYISYIDSSNYSKAYELLYENFKNTYFPTLLEFEEYARKKYPTEMIAEYANMEREGEVYVLNVKIKNPLDSNSQELQQNFVIKENDLNDFELSFNVE